MDLSLDLGQFYLNFRPFFGILGHFFLGVHICMYPCQKSMRTNMFRNFRVKKKPVKKSIFLVTFITFITLSFDVTLVSSTSTFYNTTKR